jgi:VWFA-related protein
VTVSGGGALPSVAITLSGAGSVTTTDAGGNYTFPGLTNGFYTITPSLTGYTFNPASKAVVIKGGNATSNNFTAKTTSTPTTPSISTQGSLDFGVALIGASSSRQLLISNIGFGTLNIGQLSLPTGSSFHIIKDCSGTSIPSGGTCSLTLSLTPNSQSNFSDTLTIPSNDSTKNPLGVALTGKGRALNALINNVTTDGNKVKLLVSLSNIAGDPIVGLINTCFTIRENGIQKAISNFTHPITTPISVDLVWDNSGSISASDQSVIQSSAKSFVAKLVNGYDEMGVIKFSFAIGAKTDFTTDLSVVNAAIDAPYPADTGGTSLYDTLITAIDETAFRTNSRSAIIVCSDGYDEGSINTLTAVIDRAILKDVPIYAIAYTNAPHPKPEVMQQLAQETGGEFFLSPSPSELAGIYDNISKILSQQYLLEYVSTSSGGATISLNVVVNNNGDLGEASKEATGCY